VSVVAYRLSAIHGFVGISPLRLAEFGRRKTSFSRFPLSFLGYHILSSSCDSGPPRILGWTHLVILSAFRYSFTLSHWSHHRLMAWPHQSLFCVIMLWFVIMS